MATERENYQAALDEAVKDLREAYATGKMKPNVNGPVSVDFSRYMRDLRDHISWLKEMIASCEGGFEVYSEADT